MKRSRRPAAPFPSTIAFDTYEGQVSLGEQSKADLERICELLNSAERPELREHLREPVKAWQESGPNLEKMMWGSHKHIRDCLWTLCSGAAWMPTTEGRAMLFPHPDYSRLEGLIGRERVNKQKPDGEWMLNPEVEAWKEFGYFTLNPHCEELAGPCMRCGNYYVKKRASQKVYCSRRCGNAATAVARTSERLANERKDKLERAQAAIEKWIRTKTQQGWKHWVANKTGIDLRFLTRAVNERNLIPPKLER
jgi:hypothetical protein